MNIFPFYSDSRHPEEHKRGTKKSVLTPKQKKARKKNKVAKKSRKQSRK
ncbi:hypothetical protein HN803_07595 [candidate division WWE3 bacterium]|nr:hypothetical protein [candidate division WWE3 bacterium]